MSIEKIKEDLWIQDGLLGWKIVYPIRKDLDKKISITNINWKHLVIGSWANILFVVIFLVILLSLTRAYTYDIEVCKEYMEDPCKHCSAMLLPEDSTLDKIDFNLKDIENIIVKDEGVIQDSST